MKLILASQSPYRRQQLTQFGFRFEAHSPKVEEEQLKKSGPTDLVELTLFLAEKKARSLSTDFPRDLILGSDQLVELSGERLDKPGSKEKAFAQLTKMSGREHRLITSLTMVVGEEIRLYTDITQVRFKTLTVDEIQSYLDVDQPFDCAGSYKIEKAGLSLIESLSTQDPSAIQGLPLMSLLRGLESFRLKPSLFWERK